MTRNSKMLIQIRKVNLMLIKNALVEALAVEFQIVGKSKTATIERKTAKISSNFVRISTNLVLKGLENLGKVSKSGFQAYKTLNSQNYSQNLAILEI